MGVEKKMLKNCVVEALSVIAELMNDDYDFSRPVVNIPSLDIFEQRNPPIASFPTNYDSDVQNHGDAD